MMNATQTQSIKNEAGQALSTLFNLQTAGEVKAQALDIYRTARALIKRGQSQLHLDFSKMTSNSEVTLRLPMSHIVVAEDQAVFTSGLVKGKSVRDTLAQALAHIQNAPVRIPAIHRRRPIFD